MRPAPATRCDPGPATVSTLAVAGAPPAQELPPARRRSQRRGERQRRPDDRRQPGELAQQRRDEQLEAQLAADRVAGEADHRHAAVARERLRSARLHVARADVRAERLEQLAHDLVLAHRDAAAGDDELGAARDRPVEARRPSAAGVVAGQLQIDDVGADGRGRGASAMPFASGRSAVAERRPRRDELVARADDRDPHARAHGDVVQVRRRPARRGAGRRAAGRRAAGPPRRRGRIPASRTYSPACRARERSRPRAVDRRCPRPARPHPRPRGTGAPVMIADRRARAPGQRGRPRAAATRRAIGSTTGDRGEVGGAHREPVHLRVAERRQVDRADAPRPRSPGRAREARGTSSSGRSRSGASSRGSWRRSPRDRRRSGCPGAALTVSTSAGSGRP